MANERWERAVELAEALREDAQAWAEGRSALVRAPLALYLGYAGLRHVIDPMYRSWFAGITLIFHEMGHLFFSYFGRTLMFLGGSIMQTLVPLAAGAHLLLKQRDYFGVAVCLSWLSFSDWEMATYMDDANKERLALVGFSGNPEHDWSTLFTQWHILNYCETIATFVRGIAFLTWGASMALAAWLCFRMWKSEKSPG